MPTNESVEFFFRFLQERFNSFRKALNAFLQVITLDNRPQKIEAARAVLTCLNDLKSAMSTPDHPPWISTLEAKLNWYVSYVSNQADAGLQLMQTILANYSSIEKQTWNFADASANAAINFAAIYQEYYNGSRVPDLFDELVTQLETIINSGEIDSLQATKALEKLVATIKKNSRGDLFSTRGAWEFTQLFFKNYALEILESLPGLKHAVKALRKTMSELDLEFSQVHEKIRQRLSDATKADLPMLQYRAFVLPAPKDDSPENASHQNEPPDPRNQWS